MTTRMTTPTTMTTSMITTATTMMTDVVVVPSLGTDGIPVVVVGPIVWEGKVVPIDWVGLVFSGVDAVEMKYTA